MSNRDIDLYSRFFTDCCRAWSEDPVANVNFLQIIERYFNEKLKEDGYVFLSDIYRYLKIPLTKICIITGWIYDKNKTKQIDFHLPDLEYYEAIDIELSDPDIPIFIKPDGVIIDVVGGDY